MIEGFIFAIFDLILLIVFILPIMKRINKDRLSNRDLSLFLIFFFFSLYTLFLFELITLSDVFTVWATLVLAVIAARTFNENKRLHEETERRELQDREERLKKEQRDRTERLLKEISGWAKKSTGSYFRIYGKRSR